MDSKSLIKYLQTCFPGNYQNVTTAMFEAEKRESSVIENILHYLYHLNFLMI